jgi:phage shock protein PspC (stress-responsive transcriptional regulator)
MAMSDELGKLGDLHQRGILSDEEFSRAKARVLGESTGQSPQPALAAVNALRRSRSDRWLGGVCGGLAQISGLAAWMWRLIFTLLVLCAGSGALVYLLLWILLPQDEAPLSGQPGRAQGA